MNSKKEWETIERMMVGDFDPDQPRDENGKWSDTGAGSASSGEKAPSGNISKRVHDHPYMKSALRKEGTRRILEGMDPRDQDKVLKAVSRAVASPGGKEATLRWGVGGRRSVTVKPAGNGRTGYEVHTYFPGRVPSFSVHQDIDSVATFVLIGLRDGGYKGGALTIE